MGVVGDDGVGCVRADSVEVEGVGWEYGWELGCGMYMGGVRLKRSLHRW